LLKRTPSVFVFALALLAAASTWFYADHILKPAQVAIAVAHHRPRGNLSDLYPRWLGARELLLHGRNPYSAEITQEIQQGYYGRALDPEQPDDPKDEQRFAYPVYVAFLLAPSVTLPFDLVQSGFRWTLVALTGGSVLLWLQVLRWKISPWAAALCVTLVLGSVPVMQGIRLQQLSLLVAGLLAACGACLLWNYLFCAGVFLALATIKPQLVWPLVLWLMLWAGCEWRSRRRFVFGFGLAMALLLGGAQLLLPGWWRMFAAAVGEYQRYTHNQSVLQVLCGTIAGRVLEVLAVSGCAFCLWRVLREPASSLGFGRAFGVVLALTALVVPMYAPYNQVLLVPAILALARDTRDLGCDSRLSRYGRAIGGLLLVWPWIATLGLGAASFWLSMEQKQMVWTLPFYTTFALPVVILSLAVLDMQTSQA
jgi:hypothetical protein